MSQGRGDGGWLRVPPGRFGAASAQSRPATSRRRAQVTAVVGGRGPRPLLLPRPLRRPRPRDYWGPAWCLTSSQRAQGASVLRPVRRMHAPIGNLLQFFERQQVVVPAESALAAILDAAVLSQHPHVGVEHLPVGVAVVVPLDLWL